MTLPCRICAQPTRLAYTLRSQRTPLDVPMYYCPGCQAYFSNGGPVSYEDVDLTGYYARYATPIKRRYARTLEFFEKIVRPARFIDIGAGMGYSLEVAHERGWKAAGIEPNIALARSAQSRGLAVDHKYLDANTTGQYELAVIDNVLEHVTDPKGFLINAARLLTRDGLLVVAIPPMDWLRDALGSFRFVRERVKRPQLNVFVETDEHVNVLGRVAMAKLIDSVGGLTLMPIRFHHSSLFDNPIARALGIDDGYYFIRKSAAPRNVGS